jgi:hypothetical protein
MPYYRVDEGQRRPCLFVATLFTIFVKNGMIIGKTSLP